MTTGNTALGSGFSEISQNIPKNNNKQQICHIIHEIRRFKSWTESLMFHFTMLLQTTHKTMRTSLALLQNGVIAEESFSSPDYMDTEEYNESTVHV